MIKNKNFYRLTYIMLHFNKPSTLLLYFSIFAVLLLSIKIPFAKNTFIDHNAIEEVYSGKRSYANAAWWGFNINDSTCAVQSAINSGANKVVIPNLGNDWIVRPIFLESDQEIFFEKGVTIRAKEKEYKKANDCIFKAIGKKNITLRGHNTALIMRKDDYKSIFYEKSEWRTILALYGCENVSIFGLRLEKSGGDGIYLGHHRISPCKNILIEDCISDDNYRSGLAVISVENLFVNKCSFSNTNGTEPYVGIGIEPNDWYNKIINVNIRNCNLIDNKGHGIILYLSRFNSESEDISVLIESCSIKGGSGYGITVGGIKDKGPKGLIKFKDCIVEETYLAGAYIYDKSIDGIKLEFENCVWRDVAKEYLNRNGKQNVPIHIHLKNANLVKKIGGIEFKNCYLFDNSKRPLILANSQERCVSGLTGNITVYNVNGAKQVIENDCGENKLKIIDFYNK